MIGALTYIQLVGTLLTFWWITAEVTRTKTSKGKPYTLGLMGAIVPAICWVLFMWLSGLLWTFWTK